MKELNEQQIKALQKIDSELEKDISLIIEHAKNGHFFDLYYVVYNLKLLRLHSIINDKEESKRSIDETISNSLDDVFKYVIQLLVKYGDSNLIYEKETEQPFVNFELVNLLIDQCKYINSKYESKSIIQLFGVELLDDEVKRVKIDFTDFEYNEDVNNFLSYFLRIDRDNDIKNSNKQNHDEILKDFKGEYQPSNDLFLKAFNISLDEYCDLILWLINRSQEKILGSIEFFERLENGNINEQSLKTMFAFLPSFLIEIDEFSSHFDVKYNTIIDLMTFDNEKFEEKELKFHYLTRSPIIKIMNQYLISPELLLDSLHTNVHYSLLESPIVKEDYKAKQASNYIDKLVEISSAFGYWEVDRELELYENSAQIGDIDLILCNKKKQYILIEAKNHALDMNIYFKDINKTKNHLIKLKSTWEKKVQKRIDHLKDNHDSYSIPKTYTYIVVSRFPEIISHYTNLLALSTIEFEHWLKKDMWSSDFVTITDDFYQQHEKNYTQEDLEKLSEQNFFFGKFSDK